VQLALMEAEGFRAPATIQSLNFPAVGGGARVVFSVLSDDYTVGACRESDIANLVADGSLEQGEVVVIRSVPAVPEVVFVCREADRIYFGRILAGLGLRLASPGDDAEEMLAAALLENSGMGGLRPISEEEIARAAALFERMKGGDHRGAHGPY
jgi:hypothetical protein